MQVRRVVTGDVDGCSVVVSDERVDPITIALMPGNEFHRIWGGDAPPSVPNGGRPTDAPGYFPPEAGYRFGLVTLAPAISAAPAAVDMAAAMAEVEAKLPGLPESLEPDHPGMHRTATVDFDLILSGEAWLELDDGAEVLLRAGDSVVVSGQRHAWSNRAAVPCVMATVCIGGHLVL